MSTMKNSSRARRVARFLLIGLVLILLADVSLGYALQAYITDDCKHETIYQTPGGIGTATWTTDKYTAINHACQISGLESRLEITFLPFNKARLTRQIEREIEACEDLPIVYDGWGCYVP